MFENHDFGRSRIARVERVNVKIAETAGKVTLLNRRKLLILEEQDKVFI
jgi:hypothetical protein